MNKFSQHEMKMVSEQEVAEMAESEIKQLFLELQSQLALAASELAKLEEQGSSKEISRIASNLDTIRHGAQELTERMREVYIPSAETEEVLDNFEQIRDSGRVNMLLVEGEPGTGKTALGYDIAREKIESGESTLLTHIRVKADTTAKSLLYTIDRTGRMADANGVDGLPEDMRAESQKWMASIISGDVDPDTDEGYIKFHKRLDAVKKLSNASTDISLEKYVHLGPLGEAIYQSSQSKEVVLIFDELEKAPEDVIQGLLDELEHMEFTISETGQQIKGDKSKITILVTTNTEQSNKIIPAFRRRALYYYMEFPKQEHLQEIIKSNFPDISTQVLDLATMLIKTLRSMNGLEKKPSIPELLHWLELVVGGGENLNLLDKNKIPYLETLIKYKDDRDMVLRDFEAKQREVKEIQETTELPLFAVKALSGEKVVKLRNTSLNENYLNASEEQKEMLAKFSSAGVLFTTAKRENVRNREKLTSFKFTSPGVCYYDDDMAYVPPDIETTIVSVISHESKVFSSQEIKFHQIYESTTGYVRGIVKIDNNFCDAFQDLKTKKFIVLIPYEAKSGV